MKLMIWFSVLEKAIVYGCTLDAYCCVQTLIAMGIPGENIQLVEPPSIYQVSRVWWSILWEYFEPIQWLSKFYLNHLHIHVCGMMILKMFLIKINDLVQFFINISFTLVNLFQWPQNWWCCETGHGCQWSPGAFWVHSGPMEWWGWCFRDHICQFYI